MALGEEPSSVAHAARPRGDRGPAALTTYPHDIEKHPRPWAEERFRHIVRWRAPEAGGHFPALEMPGEFVRDLRQGLASVLAAS